MRKTISEPVPRSTGVRCSLVTLDQRAPAPHGSARPSQADLQAEIAAAREELAANLAALKSQTAAPALARRGLRAAAGWFTDEYGGVRPERVAIAAGVVVGVIALRAITRRR